MKRNILTLSTVAIMAATIALGGPATSSGSGYSPRTTLDRIEKSKLRTDTIAVPDMQCGTCEKTISSVLKKLQGVGTVTADAEANVVVVSYDPRRITRTRIEKAIARAGYDAGSARTTAAAQNALPMCCRPGAHE